MDGTTWRPWARAHGRAQGRQAGFRRLPGPTSWTEGKSLFYWLLQAQPPAFITTASAQHGPGARSLRIFNGRTERKPV